MPFVRQTNFSAGELSPFLWGRTDLSKWAQGLRTCRNFFISKAGAAVSRPGTRYIGETKLGGTPVRLVPFVYSDEQTYVLEMGDGYIRFWSFGAAVLGAAAPTGDGTCLGVEYEVATPYLATDLDRLQWAQSGDVLVFTHPDYPASELRRLAHASWTFGALSFARPLGTEEPDGAYLDVATVDSTGDSTHPPREWAYVITRLWRNNSTGAVTETAPFRITQSATALWPTAGLADLPARFVVYSDMPVTVWLPTQGYSTIPSGFSAIATRIYRGRGGLYGWVGDVEAGIEAFTDVGQEPDYALAPPQGRDPFDGYPTAVAYFQERRVFGGTPTRPSVVLASTVGDYSNFDDRLVQVADEALNLELASRKREDIRSMVGLNRLLIATNSSIWSLAGSGGPLTFDSVDARVEEEIGATHLPPLLIDGAVLYARAKSQGVRALAFDRDRDGFTGIDISTVSQHLFLGETRASSQGATLFTPTGTKELVDWCYAEDPWGLVWAVRDDGALLSLTFSKEQEMWAWARHDTDGAVKNVCSVPEGDEDAVYLVVHRQLPGALVGTGYSTLFLPNSNRYCIERMSTRTRKGSPDDDAAVDCAVRYEGAPTTAITGLSHLEGKEVYAVSFGNPPQGPYTVTGGGIVLGETPATPFIDGSYAPIVVVHVGLLFTPDLETLDVISTDARMRQKNVVSVGFEVDQTRGLSAGPDFDNLKEARARQVSDSYSGISAATGLVKVPIRGTWDESARAVLRQTQPLPVTVLGLTREVELGGS